jgi:hypothetical protein
MGGIGRRLALGKNRKTISEKQPTTTTTKKGKKRKRISLPQFLFILGMFLCDYETDPQNGSNFLVLVSK